MQAGRKNKWSWIVLITALVIALTALAFSICRTEPLTWDWIGILVGVLALLVTALIGWQIYSAIDFDRKIKSVKELTELINRQIALTNLSSSMASSDFYYQLCTNDMRNIGFKYIQHSLFAIRYASAMGDFATCNILVKSILEVIVNPEEIKLSRHNKDLIFTVLYEIKNEGKINRYRELLQMLTKIDQQEEDNQ